MAAAQANQINTILDAKRARQESEVIALDRKLSAVYLELERRSNVAFGREEVIA